MQEIIQTLTEELKARDEKLKEANLAAQKQTQRYLQEVRRKELTCIIINDKRKLYGCLFKILKN